MRIHRFMILSLVAFLGTACTTHASLIPQDTDSAEQSCKRQKTEIPAFSPDAKYLNPIPPHEMALHNQLNLTGTPFCLVNPPQTPKILPTSRDLKGMKNPGALLQFFQDCFSGCLGFHSQEALQLFLDQLSPLVQEPTSLYETKQIKEVSVFFATLLKLFGSKSPLTISSPKYHFQSALELNKFLIPHLPNTKNEVYQKLSSGCCVVLIDLPCPYVSPKWFDFGPQLVMLILKDIQLRHLYLSPEQVPNLSVLMLLGSVFPDTSVVCTSPIKYLVLNEIRLSETESFKHESPGTFGTKNLRFNSRILDGLTLIYNTLQKLPSLPPTLTTLRLTGNKKLSDISSLCDCPLLENIYMALTPALPSLDSLPRKAYKTLSIDLHQFLPTGVTAALLKRFDGESQKALCLQETSLEKSDLNQATGSRSPIETLPAEFRHGKIY